ncbi:hypothetical protein TELCIR_19855 [Teladorsagia circumcincta]|uniref:Uncharacterized protein n=1 Tax=Teladorsagia circumcincta TaxID=45464 RepID=A0A2G9TL92_TELCI|nr:hypothetical protein TELCIR_19855 [Teladorsagia circumcincta]
MTVLLDIVAGAMPKSNSIPLLDKMCAPRLTYLLEDARSDPYKSNANAEHLPNCSIGKNRQNYVEKEWNKIFSRIDHVFLFLFQSANVLVLLMFLRYAFIPVPELPEDFTDPKGKERKSLRYPLCSLEYSRCVGQLRSSSRNGVSFEDD